MQCAPLTEGHSTGEPAAAKILRFRCDSVSSSLRSRLLFPPVDSSFSEFLRGHGSIDSATPRGTQIFSIWSWLNVNSKEMKPRIINSAKTTTDHRVTVIHLFRISCALEKCSNLRMVLPAFTFSRTSKRVLLCLLISHWKRSQSKCNCQWYEKVMQDKLEKKKKKDKPFKDLKHEQPQTFQKH